MRLESVAFRYRRKDPWVFRDVTLSLARGSVSEVTGHNGAGKSTLLRVIAGLRRPGAGVVKDRPARVGYAPERFPVDQPFSVRAYLGHMAAMRRIPADVAGVWAERLRFAHLLDVRLPELSKGSAQKIGLAQAFMADPELLILDEPFAGLDAATRDALPALISELAANGTTVVVSDHQRCIEAMPGIDRLHVADRTVTPLAPPNATHPTPKTDARTHPAPTDNNKTAPTPGDSIQIGPAPSDNTETHPAPADDSMTQPAPSDGSRTGPAAEDSAQGSPAPGDDKATHPAPSHATDTRPALEGHSTTRPAPSGGTMTPVAPADGTDTHPASSDDGGTGLEPGENTETHIAPEDDGRSLPVAGRGGLAPVVPGGGSGWAVLEVEVPGGEADTVESKLRADGYRVRRREG
ncbi:ATP-binding cassette domain-containing protein [Spirillospora sp. CA-142024]|uniref:ABC transporter ATP-binding protein n=1 Tax=Spirillospora sp. CA-142024 TaxID=3240036 RepID=UPI003D94C9FA